MSTGEVAAGLIHTLRCEYARFGSPAGATLRAMTQPRFLKLSDVAEVLNISAAQTYALVRSGELAAMKVGGRGQWRVDRGELEAFIVRAHEQTREFVASHPYGSGELG